jgi:hypothetical protein
MNQEMHAANVIECGSIYAGPCTCGPAVHINLERVKGELTATCILSLSDCEGLIKQIRASMKEIRNATNGGNDMAVVMPIKFTDGKTPVYPDLREDQIIHTKDAKIEVVCIDHGMGSGKPSVALRVDLPDGQIIISETSARLFCTAARAIMARYPNLFDD